MADPLLVCVPDSAAAELLGDVGGRVRPVLWDGRSTPGAEVLRAEVLVAPYGGPRVAPAVFVDAMPDLRLVQLCSAGAEAWRGALPARAVLCRGAGVHTASTAELAVGLVLAVMRDLSRFVHQQDDQRWYCGPTDSLAGRRAVVIGAGDIGSAVARRLEAFEVEVVLVARSARGAVRASSELPLLLPTADLVVLVVPLTEDTRGLVDAAFLAAMPDGALLVNVARGAVVDTDALVAELSSGRIRAALDVTDPEPLPAGHPLWSTPGTLLTPHAGGGTAGWIDRAYGLVREQVARLFDGRPLLHQVR